MSPAAVLTKRKHHKENNDPEALDYRHPLYLGDWERSIVGIHDTLAVDDVDEPHIKRRHVILDKHPEIKQLYGVEPLTKYVILVTVALQLGLAYYFGRVDTGNAWLLHLVAYVVGASCTQIYGVIMHEACHGLVFESLLLNRLAGFACNLGIPFPIAASFRRYHLEHHAYQGVFGKDPDLPLQFEVNFIKGNPLMKMLFLFFYPIMYVVRGAALGKKPSKWELVNWVFTIASDVAIYHACGARGFYYLFISLWLGYGIHPAAAHFIQEHFTFDDGQETYSYYGPLNYIFLNVGYHNEHHDFTKVPWTKLPQIKAMAPEFYNSLKAHTSWLKVHWDFIFDRKIGPQSRVGRSYEDHRAGRKMVVANRLLKDDSRYSENGFERRDFPSMPRSASKADSAIEAL